MHVSVLIPEGPSVIASITGTHHVFTQASRSLEAAGKPPLFQVHLIGLTKEIQLFNGLYSIRPDATPDMVQKTDLIVIPALDGDIVAGLEKNREWIPWIVSQYKRGAEVASLCTGAFLLASTGLLKGRKCTTHWGFIDDFKSCFPDVQLAGDRVITDENGIYTSGGAFSFLNLILYLVEKHAGREVAILCSKLFEIDIERHTQSPFTLFVGQKRHDDDAVLRAQEFMESNVGEKISVDQLASRFAVSRRNFERRFRKATMNSPVEYLQRLKIEAAKKLLETGRENISEAMYAVGYSDSKAFRNVFRKITGLSPLEYRNKYNKEALAEG